MRKEIKRAKRKKTNITIGYYIINYCNTCAEESTGRPNHYRLIYVGDVTRKCMLKDGMKSDDQRD